MIEESYVSFDIAKLLKEAGFEEKVNSCFMYDKYADKDEYEYEGGYALVRKSIFDNYNCYENAISQPTQALAARWLREVHRIFVDVTFIPPFVDGDVWQYFVGRMDEMVWAVDFEPSERKYSTYEEALEEGIKRGLELIKK